MLIEHQYPRYSFSSVKETRQELKDAYANLAGVDMQESPIDIERLLEWIQQAEAWLREPMKLDMHGRAHDRMGRFTSKRNLYE